jgi:hypothetical protein
LVGGEAVEVGEGDAVWKGGWVSGV